MKSHHPCRNGILFVLCLLAAACADSRRDQARKGLKALERGKPAEAADWLAKSLAGATPSPEQAPAWNALGLARHRAGDARAAEEAFKVGVSLDPAGFPANYNYGALLMEEGRLQEARVLLETAAKADTNRTEALELLGLAHLRDGDPVKAQRWLVQAVQRREHPRILNALALAYLETKGPAYARDVLERAIALDPSFAPAHHNLAALLDAHAGEPEKALSHYETYLKLDPQGKDAPPARERVKELAAQLDARIRPTATPLPTATATPAPTATAVPTATATPVPAATALPTPKATPAATATAVPSPTPAPAATATPTPKPTAAPTATPKPTPTPKATPAPQATVPPAPRPTLAAIPTPTATPEPLEDNVEKQIDLLLARARESVREGNAANALNLCLQAAATASRENRNDLEERSVRAAVALSPDSARAHYALGRYFMERQTPADAVEPFRQASLLEPSWLRAHQATADAAIQAGQFQVALEALRKAETTAPNSPDALYALAVFYQDRLDVRSSARLKLNQFMERFPGDPRSDEVRSRLLRLGPESVPTPVPTLPAPPVGTARPAVETGGSSLSPRTLMPKPGATPTETPSPARERAMRPYNRGTAHQAKGELDKAAPLYEEAIRIDPTYTRAMYNLGLIRQKEGKRAEAETLYRRALEVEPDMLVARFNLALTLQEDGRSEEADIVLRRVLAQDPAYAPAHLVLADILAANPASRKQAETHYRRFLELSPDDHPRKAGVQRWIASQ